MARASPQLEIVCAEQIQTEEINKRGHNVRVIAGEYHPSGSGHRQSNTDSFEFKWLQFLASHFFVCNIYRSSLILQPTKVKFMPFLDRPSSHWYELHPKTEVSADIDNILVVLHLPLLRKTVLLPLGAKRFLKTKQW